MESRHQVHVGGLVPICAGDRQHLPRQAVHIGGLNVAGEHAVHLRLHRVGVRECLDQLGGVRWSDPQHGALATTVHLAVELGLGGNLEFDTSFADHTVIVVKPDGVDDFADRGSFALDGELLVVENYGREECLIVGFVGLGWMVHKSPK